MKTATHQQLYSLQNVLKLIIHLHICSKV